MTELVDGDADYEGDGEGGKGDKRADGVNLELVEEAEEQFSSLVEFLAYRGVRGFAVYLI